MSWLSQAGSGEAVEGVLRACFFCGVDSTRITWFLGAVVGATVLGMMCFAAWGIVTGHLRDEQGLARRALEAEGSDLVSEEELP